MDKVRYAIIGCGSVSWNRYWPRIAEITRGQLVAACDSHVERARRPAEMYSIPYFTDLDEMMAKVPFDLLVNLTNNTSHFSLNLKALQAGKHVYTQKPMTVTSAEATTLIEEAKRRNLKLVSEAAAAIFLVNRTVKQLLDQGVLGKVVWAHAACTHPGPASNDGFPTDPSWYYKKGGGPFDPGIERIHLLTYLLGPCKRVTALSGINQSEVVVRGGPFKGKKVTVEQDDVTLLLMDFGDAIFGLVDAVWVDHQRASMAPAMEIHGHKGVLAVMKGSSREPGQRDFDLRLYRDEPSLGVRGWEQVEAIPPLRPEPSIAITGLVHAIDCILDDTKPVLSGEHARHCIEIIEQCYLSARTGAAQPIETTF